MSRYRRARVPGASYFFTANLLDRRSDLLTRHIDRLREAVRKSGKGKRKRGRIYFLPLYVQKMTARLLTVPTLRASKLPLMLSLLAVY